MAGRDKSFIAPAFIHIDIDDLWAVAECYGLSVADEIRHHITRDALPRFASLFSRLGIRATFFVVGRDLETDSFAQQVRNLLDDGHEVANHSHTHRLDFRVLSREELTVEITQCHQLVSEKLGRQMIGFRAPGYAASHALTEVLQANSYRYDASLMPSPFGPVFRWMDARLRRQIRQEPLNSPPSTTPPAASPRLKTQYPLISDTFHTLWPKPLGDNAGALIRLPSAVAPGLRLPFQAGVCMRLGWPYFRANLELYRRLPALPFTFLFHAADLADFSFIPIPFFQNSPFFGSPLSHRLSHAERFLKTISHIRPITTTEDWLS